MSAIVLYNQNIVKRDPVEEALNIFLQEVKRDMMLSTYKTYKSCLEDFSLWVKDNPFELGGDTRTHLREYRSFIRDQSFKAGTKNLLLSVVRSFFKSLLKKGIIAVDPSPVMENFKESMGLKRSALTKRQIEGIIARLDEDQRINARRDRALFILLVSVGIRIAEAANLKVEDLGIVNERRVAYLKRKGYEDKDNFVILTDKVYMMLMEYLDGREEGNIFVSYRTGEGMSPADLSRTMKTLFRRCGIDSPMITAHSTRHGFAIMAIEGGASLISLSKSLNHRNISTTMHYLESYDRFNAAAEDVIAFAY